MHNNQWAVHYLKNLLNAIFVDAVVKNQDFASVIIYLLENIVLRADC